MASALDRGRVGNENVDTEEGESEAGLAKGEGRRVMARKPTIQQVQFSLARLRGDKQTDALAFAGYSPKTNPSEIEKRCISLGLLPDAEELRRDVEEWRAAARENIFRVLSSNSEEIALALVARAVISTREDGTEIPGDLDSIREALDRLLGAVERGTTLRGDPSAPLLVGKVYAGGFDPNEEV